MPIQDNLRSRRGEIFKDSFGTSWETTNALTVSCYGGGGLPAAVNIRTLQACTCGGKPLPHMIVRGFQIDTNGHIEFLDDAVKELDLRGLAYVECQTQHRPMTQIYINKSWKPGDGDQSIAVPGTDWEFGDMAEVADVIARDGILSDEFWIDVEREWRRDFVRKEFGEIMGQLPQDVQELFDTIPRDDGVDILSQALEDEEAGQFEDDAFAVDMETISSLSDTIERYVREECHCPTP